MLKGVAAAIAAVGVALGFVLASGGAAQADYVYCDPHTNTCYTVVTSPVSDPPSNPDPTTGFTPGAPTCVYYKGSQNVEIPCTSTGSDYWSNTRQCYVSIATGSDQQQPPPPGAKTTGAWYNCDPYTGPLRCDPTTDGVCRDPYGGTFWSNTPPPGIKTLSPRQAAALLINSFQLRGIDIGFAPDPNTPGAKSYVGVPIWMWVNNPQPLTYGPYTQTSALGGVTITATAHVTSIIWNMGDGHSVACANMGTAFQVQYGAVDSPTCGYRYQKTSASQPTGRYAITATSQWSVDWNGGGQSGTIPLTSTSNTSVQINELQSVNVRGNGG